MNRIDLLFKKKNKRVLNIFLTGGYPQLNTALELVPKLEELGVDLVELGMPYSDPLADGPVIQNSSAIALANGMTLDKLFGQVSAIRKASSIPIILMGYLNQMLQYGTDRFLKNASDAGVDGLIIPDLPMEVYSNEYKSKFELNGLKISFLITPQTSDQRTIRADELSSGFLYVVSSSSITGVNKSVNEQQTDYFKRIQALPLKAPKLIGFGIHDNTTFSNACNYAEGAIVGSAFIKTLKKEGSFEKAEAFIKQLLSPV